MVLGLLGGEDVAGMIFIDDDPHFWPEVRAGESLFVHKLAVIPAAQGRGLATQLLEFARAEAQAQGKRYLRLDCNAARPKLRRFYEARGFSYAGTRVLGALEAALYEQQATR